MKNTVITRLVTGFSLTERRNNLDEPGFVKATDSGCHPIGQRPPSLKPAHPGFFMLVCSYTRQGASANRSEWTVPKKHRLPRKGEPEKTGDCRGPAWKGKPADPLNDSLNGDVGRQGRACGVHQPLSKSSGFDKEFSGIRLAGRIRNPGVSPNPCISQPMVKQKEGVAT